MKPRCWLSAVSEDPMKFLSYPVTCTYEARESYGSFLEVLHEEYFQGYHIDC